MSEQQRKDIRNIAIIAHVDHGKTTLVDSMLKQSGVFRSGEEVADRVLDSNALERERGITILAKNVSITWKGIKINIIDTPGHSDFGAEVERTLSMADGVLLLVDAAEGPLPQTRFVLREAIKLGHRIIVVINKIDRQDARPDAVLDATFSLFCDLGASDAQADFPTIYAIGKDGIAKRELADESKDLSPLLDMIVAEVPPPLVDPDAPFRMLVSNIEHDDYVGRTAIGRIKEGSVRAGATLACLGVNSRAQTKIRALFNFQNLARVNTEGAEAGEIVSIAGFENVEIGDTIADVTVQEALPRIRVEEPTIKVRFMVNTSPFAGKAGKWVTSRHLRERLERETRRNLALRLEDGESPDSFIVYGRGELMIAVLVETMRREGYELAIGMPEVVVREVNGVRSEPVERAVIDVPEEYVGTVTSSLGERKGVMEQMHNLGHGRVRLEFVIPSRNLMGYRSQFLTQTRGTGLFNTMFEGWQPFAGQRLRRTTGALVSDRSGATTPYAIFQLQPRGIIFIEPGTQVYEGMVVGEHNRNNDLDVNITREKKLTNIRAAGRDENVVLVPAHIMNIEQALEFIDHDELIEVTPDAIRIRKTVLECSRRPKRDPE